MSLEDRVDALENEVAILREKSREHDQKLEDILAVAVGLHNDLAALERKVDRGFERIDRRFEQMDRRFEQMDRRFEQMDRRFDELPDMIARIVGEALRSQGRG